MLDNACTGAARIERKQSVTCYANLNPAKTPPST